MPLFIIDTCSSEDNGDVKKCHSQRVRSISLPNCQKIYKDLTGAIHHSLDDRYQHLLRRSQSYSLVENVNHKNFQMKSAFESTNFLDPTMNFNSPGESSSRYSLYESIFNLSDNGQVSSTWKTDQKLLDMQHHPMIIINKFPSLTAHNYQDKCTQWLNHLHPL